MSQGIPKYEQASDKMHERKVADFLGIVWKEQPIPTREFDGVDFAMVQFSTEARSAQTVRLLEVKCRDRFMPFYPDFRISNRKWETLCNLSATMGMTVTLAVYDKSTGNVWFVHAVENNRQWVADAFGRSDRPDDPNAIEPAAVIPFASFVHAGMIR